MTTERETEALAEVLGSAKFDGVGHALAHGFRDMKVHCTCGWESEENFSSPGRAARSFAAFAHHQAEAVLASDWLADHDARIVAEAEARGAERTAQAIEVERARDVYQHPVGLTSEACYYEGARDAYDNAARIARAALADREEEA